MLKDWPRYHYTARMLKVVDGDTFDVDMDFGGTKREEIRIRLIGTRGGVNTPELRDRSPEVRTEAQAAKARVAALAPPGTRLYIRTELDKVDGFRRWLGEVLLEDGTNIGDLLLAEGLAEAWTR